MAPSPDSGNTSCIKYTDPYFLDKGDTLTLQLVTSQFSGSNYMNWSKSVHMALLVRNKLGFVTGALARPSLDNPDYQKWIRVDYMVMCWILGSIVTVISHSLMYVTSSQHLWEEIKERYGQIDHMVYYELQNELDALKQDSLTLAEYYGRMKQIWGDMASVDSFPDCSCGELAKCSCNILKKIVDKENRNKLVRFLMGLNYKYDTLRTSILSQDPLPPLNLAFSQLLRAEKQFQMNSLITSHDEMSALIATRQSVSGYKQDPNKSQLQRSFSSGEQSNYRRDLKKQRTDRRCGHCNMRGHTKEECFQIHGVPDWYKAINPDWQRKVKGKGAIYSRSSAHLADTSLDAAYDLSPLESSGAADFDQFDSQDLNQQGGGASHALVNSVYQEVMKIMQSKGTAAHSSNFVGDLSGLANFAGPHY